MKRIFVIVLLLTCYSCKKEVVSPPHISGEEYDLMLDDNQGRYILWNKQGQQVTSSDKNSADYIFSYGISALKQGGVLLIANGEYLTKESIKLRSDISIIGKDTLSLIRRITPGNVFEGSQINNLKIRRLKIMSNLSFVEHGSGICLETNCSDNLIDSCVIREVAGHGIVIIHLDSKYNVISNNIISDCSADSGIGLMWGAGDAKIINNRVRKTKTHGIILSAGASNCVIKDNYVESSGYYRPGTARPDEFFCHGIAIDGGAVMNRAGKNHLIENNRIINSGRAGIEVADRQDSVVIKGNYISGTGLKCGDVPDQYGIYFGGGIDYGTSCLIEDNEVYNTRNEAIKIGSPGRILTTVTDDVIIRGNRIDRAKEDGVRVYKSNKVEIYNNTIANSQLSGIRVQGAGDVVSTNITIDNNLVTGSLRHGVELERTTKISIINNIFKENRREWLYSSFGVTEVTIANNDYDN